MNLYLLRHAVAMDKSEWTKDDRDRPLTKEGRRKMKKAAKGLRCLDLSLDLLLTSPYRRAYDTAWIVAKELKLKKRFQECPALAPGGDPQTLIRYLKQQERSLSSVMVVGHEPYLSRWISRLTTSSPDASLALDKGGLAKLSFDPLAKGRPATLEWLLTSKLLRSLAS